MNKQHATGSAILWWGWALAVLVMVLFASLGSWQLSRSKQKQAMLDEVEHVIAVRQAQSLALAGDGARAKLYDWAAGRGQFVDLPAVLLDNQMRDGRAGVRVYRVFKPAQAPALLVELGWLPLPPQRELPQVELPQGEQQLSGLLLPPPSSGLAAAVINEQADGRLLSTHLDPQALAEKLALKQLPPRVLRLDPQLPLGYARDLNVLPNTLSPEKHLGYAVQWFGLALTVLVTTILLSMRRRSRGREKMTE